MRQRKLNHQFQRLILKLDLFILLLDREVRFGNLPEHWPSDLRIDLDYLDYQNSPWLPLVKQLVKQVYTEEEKLALAFALILRELGFEKLV